MEEKYIFTKVGANVVKVVLDLMLFSSRTIFQS